MASTCRATAAQATIKFLKNQYVERDGVERPFFGGCFGIFGHGNAAGVGQALQQNEDFPYYLSRNEQAMVHAAVAFSKMSKRLRAFACTSSIGPGATNMVTGAATATVNRIPVLLLPGDIFARRNVAPVLQQLESPQTQDISVNDCFKPVSRYWDRISRPEQLLSALPEAMRVMTSLRDRSSDSQPAARRASGSAGVSNRFSREASLGYSPAARRGASNSTRSRHDSRGPQATAHCWRRRALFGSFRSPREVDRNARVPGYESWWDVPVAEVSEMENRPQRPRGL